MHFLNAAAVCVLLQAVGNVHAAVHTMSMDRTPSSSAVSDLKAKAGNAKLKSIASKLVDDGTPIKVQNFGDLQYSVNVGIGTPPQEFKLFIDTGSTDTWVPAKSCIVAGCRPHAKFDNATSSSYVRNGTNFTDVYGSGYTVSYVAQDTFCLGDLTIEHQEFGEAIDMAYIFSAWYTDGLLGLSFPYTSSQFTQYPLHVNAAKQGLLDDTKFSLFLANATDFSNEPSSGSELVLGGVNDAHFTGDLVNIPVRKIHDEYLRWTLPFEAFSVGDHQVNDFPDVQYALLDSGTSTLVFTPTIYKAIIAQTKAETGGDVPTVDCATLAQLPDFTFNIGGHAFSLTAYDYVLKETGQGPPMCYLAILEYSFSIPNPAGRPNVVILGEPFLRKFYSVFDFDDKNPTIGLAPSKP